MATDTEPNIQSLVDQAARYKRRLDALKKQSEKLSGRLVSIKEKLASLVPETRALAGSATDTAGGGKSWKMSAANGMEVRVTKPANKLISRISGDLVAKLKELCGRKFAKLFVQHFTCANNFRQLVFRELDNPAAEKVLSLVEEESKASVTIS